MNHLDLVSHVVLEMVDELKDLQHIFLSHKEFKEVLRKGGVLELMSEASLNVYQVGLDHSLLEDLIEDVYEEEIKTILDILADL